MSFSFLFTSPTSRWLDKLLHSWLTTKFLQDTTTSKSFEVKKKITQVRKQASLVHDGSQTNVNCAA